MDSRYDFFCRCYLTKALLAAAIACCAPLVSSKAAIVTSSWANAANGNWNVNANWTNAPAMGGFPNNGTGGVATYDAVIAATGSAYTVTLNTPITVETLTLNSANATLAHTTGTFTATDAINLNAGTYRLDGGTISATTINQAGGSMVFSSSGSNILAGNTNLVGDLNLNATSARVRLQSGSTFTGNATLNANATILAWEQTGTLNNKTINLDSPTGTAFLSIEGNNTLTLGPAMIVRGGRAQITDGFFVGTNNATLINQGQISADVSGTTLTVTPDIFTNQGTARAINGGTLTINSANWTSAATGQITATNSTVNFDGIWDNDGSIALTNSTLNLGGTFTTAGIGLANFTRSGGTVNITGTVNNTAATLPLTATTGSFILDGGIINGGQITQAGGARLIFSSNGSNRLAGGATLAADLLLDATSARVRFQSGATFTGNATLSANATILAWEQTGILDNKTINFDSPTGTAFLSIEGNNTLTLGPGMIVRGGRAQITDSFFIGTNNATLVNQGLISADTASTTLTITPDIFTNQGMARAINGGTLTINSPTWSNAASGQISATGSTLNFDGIWDNDGAIAITNSTLNFGGTFTTANLGLANFTRNGGTVNLNGTLDNTSATLALTATTGSFNLDGGIINGGQITQAGGARLVFTSNGSNRLASGAVLQNDLLLDTTSARVRLQSGSFFTGNATLSANATVLAWEQTGTLDNKTINFDSPTGTAFLSIEGNNTLTLGPDLILRGGRAQITDSFFIGTNNATLINQGQISADIAGTTLTITPDIFTNQGMARAINGSTLTINSTNWTNAASGQINATNSTLNFDSNWDNDGTLTINNSILNLGGNFTTAGIGLPGFTRTGSTVNITGNLDNTSATLPLSTATGSFNLDGGVINGGQITQAGGARLVFTSNGSNRLANGAIFVGDVLLDTTSARVRFQTGATFTGNAFLTANATVLAWEQTGTLNNKTINFDSPTGTAFLSIEGNNTLTLGPDAIVRGGRAQITDSFFIGTNNATLVNQGLISADLAATTLTITPDIFTNQGTARAINGSTLTINSTTWTNVAGGQITATNSTLNFDGDWDNNGAIAITNSTLNLGGTFSTADIGLTNFTRNGGAVNITGTLDNTSATLPLTATTGPFILDGGIISGGQITQAGGSRLVISSNGSNRLASGATLVGDLLLDTTSARVRFQSGATFTGNATLSANATVLAWEQTGTLDNKTINLDSPTGTAFLSIEGNNTLTLGPNMVVRGGRAQITDSFFIGTNNATLVNQGLISADVAGTTLTITPDVFTTLTGTLQAANGGTLNVAGGYTQTTGVTRLLGGTIVSQTSSVNDLIQINGGALEGHGRIVAHVSVNGLVSAKLGGSGLNVNGDLTVTGNPVFRFEIGGIAQGAQYGFLNEAGTTALTLDGLLQVNVVSGTEITLTPLATFTIIDSNQNLLGAFDNIANGARLTTANNIGSFQVNYGPASSFGADKVVLSNYLIPEPSSSVILLIGIGWLLLHRFRNHSYLSDSIGSKFAAL